MQGEKGTEKTPSLKFPMGKFQTHIKENMSLHYFIAHSSGLHTELDSS